MKFILIAVLTSVIVIFLMFILNISTYNGGKTVNSNSEIPNKNDKK